MNAASASFSLPSWFAYRRNRRIYVVCFFLLFLAAAAAALATTLWPLVALQFVDLLVIDSKKRKLLRPEHAAGALADHLRVLWATTYRKAYVGTLVFLALIIFLATRQGSALTNELPFTSEMAWCCFLLLIRLPIANVDWNAPDLAEPEA